MDGPWAYITIKQVQDNGVNPHRCEDVQLSDISFPTSMAYRAYATHYS